VRTTVAIGPSTGGGSVANASGAGTFAGSAGTFAGSANDSDVIDLLGPQADLEAESQAETPREKQGFVCVAGPGPCSSPSSGDC